MRSKRASTWPGGSGFDNINMDLIAGLPGETAADMEDTLEQIRALGPDSLTVHSLAIKRAARMGQEKSTTGSIASLAGDPAVMAREMSAMIRMAYGAAGKMGLFPPTTCTGRKTWPAILKMLALQRLTKQEYTIYLLWKKSSLSSPRAQAHQRRSFWMSLLTRRAAERAQRQHLAGGEREEHPGVHHPH